MCVCGQPSLVCVLLLLWPSMLCANLVWLCNPQPIIILCVWPAYCTIIIVLTCCAKGLGQTGSDRKKRREQTELLGGQWEVGRHPDMWLACVWEVSRQAYPTQPCGTYFIYYYSVWMTDMTPDRNWTCRLGRTFPLVTCIVGYSQAGGTQPDPCGHCVLLLLLLMPNPSTQCVALLPSLIVSVVL